MKTPEWKGRPIVDSAHAHELEIDAALNEFRDRMPRAQAEEKAHRAYLNEHHSVSAAHHLRGLRAAHAAGDDEAAKKHSAMYALHCKELGHDPYGEPDKDVQKRAEAEEKDAVYRFKAHKADGLLKPVEKGEKLDVGAVLAKAIPKGDEGLRGQNALENQLNTGAHGLMQDHVLEHGGNLEEVPDRGLPAVGKLRAIKPLDEKTLPTFMERGADAGQVPLKDIQHPEQHKYPIVGERTPEEVINQTLGANDVMYDRINAGVPEARRLQQWPLLPQVNARARDAQSDHHFWKWLGRSAGIGVKPVLKNPAMAGPWGLPVDDITKTEVPNFWATLRKALPDSRPGDSEFAAQVGAVQDAMQESGGQSINGGSALGGVKLHVEGQPPHPNWIKDTKASWQGKDPGERGRPASYESDGNYDPEQRPIVAPLSNGKMTGTKTPPSARLQAAGITAPQLAGPVAIKPGKTTQAGLDRAYDAQAVNETRRDNYHSGPAPDVQYGGRHWPQTYGDYMQGQENSMWTAADEAAMNAAHPIPNAVHAGVPFKFEWSGRADPGRGWASPGDVGEGWFIDANHLNPAPPGQENHFDPQGKFHEYWSPTEIQNGKSHSTWFMPDDGRPPQLMRNTSRGDYGYGHEHEATIQQHLAQFRAANPMAKGEPLNFWTALRKALPKGDEDLGGANATENQHNAGATGLMQDQILEAGGRLRAGPHLAPKHRFAPETQHTGIHHMADKLRGQLLRDQPGPIQGHISASDPKAAPPVVQSVTHTLNSGPLKDIPLTTTGLREGAYVNEDVHLANWERSKSMGLQHGTIEPANPYNLKNKKTKFDRDGEQDFWSRLGSLAKAWPKDMKQNDEHAVAHDQLHDRPGGEIVGTPEHGVAIAPPFAGKMTGTKGRLSVASREAPGKEGPAAADPRGRLSSWGSDKTLGTPQILADGKEQWVPREHRVSNNTGGYPSAAAAERAAGASVVNTVWRRDHFGWDRQSPSSDFAAHLGQDILNRPGNIKSLTGSDPSLLPPTLEVKDSDAPGIYRWLSFDWHENPEGSTSGGTYGPNLGSGRFLKARWARGPGDNETGRDAPVGVWQHTDQGFQPIAEHQHDEIRNSRWPEISWGYRPGASDLGIEDKPVFGRADVQNHLDNWHNQNPHITHLPPSLGPQPTVDPVEKAENRADKVELQAEKDLPVPAVLEKDLMPGGKGDDRPDSDFDAESLSAGVRTEMEEHGLDAARAREVAKDHLVEKRGYYRKSEAPSFWTALRKAIPKGDEGLRGQNALENRQNTHANAIAQDKFLEESGGQMKPGRVPVAMNKLTDPKMPEFMNTKYAAKGHVSSKIGKGPGQYQYDQGGVDHHFVPQIEDAKSCHICGSGAHYHYLTADSNPKNLPTVGWRTPGEVEDDILNNAVDMGEQHRRILGPVGTVGEEPHAGNMDLDGAKGWVSKPGTEEYGRDREAEYRFWDAIGKVGAQKAGERWTPSEVFGKISPFDPEDDKK